MSKQGISTGSAPNDGTGDTLLAGTIKINDNFNEIYDKFGDGTNLVSFVSFASTAGYSTNCGIASTSVLAGLAASVTDNIDINPSMIQPVKEIKSLGLYDVILNLHPEIQSQIKIKVIQEEESK